MFELIIAAILIVLNGVFALSELALVSARRPRLQILAAKGKRGAAAAMRLSEHPGRFLSTVQIGITLVGILAGAFSGAALGERMSAYLVEAGIPAGSAGVAGYALVIGAITFLSLLIGELVPKHLALKNAEGFACMMAPAMEMLSKVAAPLVWLLDGCTRAVLFVLGMSAEPESAITDEEIQTLIAEAESAGVIETAEQTMIAGVMRLGDRNVRALMTPRTEVEMLDAAASETALRKALTGSTHSIIPVYEKDADVLLGVVRLRDLVRPLNLKRKFDLKKHVQAAPVIPDTLGALAVLRTLRHADVPMALVHDEFGHFEGVVTPADILDAIAGAFKSDLDDDEPEARQRADGSWLLSGAMPADEMADLLFIELPEKPGYDTVAGFLLDKLKRIPETGEVVEASGWRFEVVDLDGRRIDKVLASRAEN
ncbi:HlyC/CorC family transporter [Nitratireductor mangrovi]|uniref:HlyC/CorC family transporter n=1 Tax=Nitratireductor mangrovi TaxID=2599600 RepID=A0A5B8L3J0_9HYPH|nr:hemolysin family protein [Nitratireductor mangrovi]QDZ02108.1 HlyC/CorC family transporter [Nitratireductor mangrovi]